MRNPLNFAAVAILAVFFSLASIPRQWIDLLSLLLSRITRTILGGAAPLHCDMPTIFANPGYIHR
ncbi:uncharacterized protein LY89DRAFT_688765 [Mollisia scopiformis]|uniref:Uncharacterized protein n=1 Tax=Mollisia scopiformis TaxID=149040 RepID=A0A194WV55_MOLSC|nr:uncharacterized protein LY89DRAFT_688765 [Mollisia scopiformis]KUJ11544.1 hypothetical protein LY89DRAFT_688765 [Mollisia scopiformis]